MEQTGRKQFTCYRSYYEAIRKIKKAADRAKAYDILMEYALDGVQPQEDELPVAVSIAFLLIKPTLDTGRKKASNGKKGGEQPSKLQANGKQTASKKEEEIEKEVEIELDVEKESYNPLTPFERFWQAYPRKEGRRDAERAFEGVDVSVDVLLRALEYQRQQPGWQKENGRYIPGPAKWLAGKRWQDSSPPDPYALGELELQAIRRIMSSPDGF